MQTITETDKALMGLMDGKALWTPGLGWLLWDGKVWAETTPAMVLESIQQQAVAEFQRALNKQRAEPDKDYRTELNGWRDVLSASRVNHVRDLVQAAVETSVQALDAYPHLLNVQNGVVDLRTGELRPHSRARLMTKAASVDYDPDAQSDAWGDVLSAIPAPEREQLQVRIAEAVTGSPLDDVTLLHGPGASGKSTFMQAVRSALGTYAMTTDGSVRSPLEVSDLRGVRLLVMDDAGPGDMDRVKRLMAPDEFCGRRMRQDAITFKRSHSMLLATNLRPSDLATDEGTLRRLSPVEFRTLAEADPTLRQLVREPETMRAALRWIVEGVVRENAAS